MEVGGFAMNTGHRLPPVGECSANLLAGDEEKVGQQKVGKRAAQDRIFHLSDNSSFENADFFAFHHSQKTNTASVGPPGAETASRDGTVSRRLFLPFVGTI